jgi:cell division transport system ATP-binding protein
MIQVFHLSKEYGKYRHALADVSFTIHKGEFVFLTGPSGAGKTTLLRLLFRDELPSEGQIIVNGRNIVALPNSKLPYFRRTVGIVFQDFKLIGRKTVFENLAFVQNILGTPSQEQKRRAYQVLKQVGLHYRMNAYPSELSGGEQQRVAIARALVNEPQLLLADEPTGNLDPALSAEIMQLFAEINLRGTVVLIATHDVELIRRMGRRVLTLDHGRLREDAARLPVSVAARDAPFLPTA